jgi:hypothetical protein
MSANPGPAGESPPTDVTQQAMPFESVADRTQAHEVKTPAEARRRRGWGPMSLRLCVSAGDSPPTDVTQRAMPFEAVAERTHVHAVKNPAEAPRRRGWWTMAPRLCVSAGDSPPTDSTQRAMPLESVVERTHVHAAKTPAEVADGTLSGGVLEPHPTPSNPWVLRAFAASRDFLLPSTTSFRLNRNKPVGREVIAKRMLPRAEE